MCRRCIVPGCEVLLITSAHLCARHWDRVPQKIKDAIAKADEQIGRAQSEQAKDVFEIERQAAFAMAVEWARKAPAVNRPFVPTGPMVV
jgi:hypothetical protein